jgi:hypothetical protein
VDLIAGAAVLLNPLQASSQGVWPVGAGPAIRVIQADKDEIRGLVVNVKSLQQVRRFLKEHGLLGTEQSAALTVAGSQLQGLNVTLVEQPPWRCLTPTRPDGGADTSAPRVSPSVDGTWDVNGIEIGTRGSDNPTNTGDSGLPPAACATAMESSWTSRPTNSGVVCAMADLREHTAADPAAGRLWPTG